jgi:hypothetical protein
VRSETRSTRTSIQLRVADSLDQVQRRQPSGPLADGRPSNVGRRAPSVDCKMGVHSLGFGRQGVQLDNLYACSF